MTSMIFINMLLTSLVKHFFLTPTFFSDISGNDTPAEDISDLKFPELSAYFSSSSSVLEESIKLLPIE